MPSRAPPAAPLLAQQLGSLSQLGGDLKGPIAHVPPLPEKRPEGDETSRLVEVDELAVPARVKRWSKNV